jgi:hypothetical protein
MKRRMHKLRWRKGVVARLGGRCALKRHKLRVEPERIRIALKRL